MGRNNVILSSVFNNVIENNELSNFRNIDKDLDINITPEPRIMYGIVFPKHTIHYTDELLEGNKIILLIDCKIVY